MCPAVPPLNLALLVRTIRNVVEMCQTVAATYPAFCILQLVLGFLPEDIVAGLWALLTHPFLVVRLCVGAAVPLLYIIHTVHSY
jgi:hypothetical protein